MRVLAKFAVLVLTVALPLTGLTAAFGATERDRDCGVPHTGQIELSDLPEGSDVVDCGVVGRELNLGDVVLDIPMPGEGVAVNGQGDAESMTTVSAYVYTADDGTISYEPDGTLATSSSTSSYAVDGCDSYYLGAFKVWGFKGTYSYYVDNEGQPGGSAYTPADTGAVLERAGATWHNEESPCFANDGSSAGQLNYAGVTSWNGDFKIVDGTSTCASRDGKSTIDTGNLDKAGGGTYVAMNCVWWNNEDVVIESDIRFNTTDVDFTYTPGSSSCDSNDYDIRSVMTHEVGHTYGMKDKGGEENYYQTMYQSSFPCKSFARNLGRSDVKHLRAKYPQ